MPNIVTVANLTKQFGQRYAVDDLSFTVAQGETLGLLGPNGAGKTSTIRMLLGLSKPSAGTVTIFGCDLSRELKQVHARIGVVFEKPNLIETLSSYQNLAITCKIYDQPLTRIQPLLERMDLWERAHDPVKTYSKGMRQRVLIARAFIHQPQLLFLDEPCSGLDPVSARMIRDYLLELKRQGITIILTSHDMAEVDELCDRIGFINHGRLVVLAEPRILKERFGQPTLRVHFYESPDQTAAIQERIITPDAKNLAWLAQLYESRQVIAVHSMEATMEQIFQNLTVAQSR